MTVIEFHELEQMNPSNGKPIWFCNRCKQIIPGFSVFYSEKETTLDIPEIYHIFDTAPLD